MFFHHRLPSCFGVRKAVAFALLVLPIALAGRAAAQPSPEQIAAIRQACRSDFITHCSGVQPGGREALQCLERNAAQLSTDCSSAVSAVAPKAVSETKPEAPAAAEAAPPQLSQPSQQDELAAVQQACTIKDFMSHCSWIQPGNPELLLCLRANAAELSPACRNVVRAPGGATPAVAAPAIAAAPPVTAPPEAPPAAIAIPAPPPPPPAPRTAAAPKRPTPRQIGAIRAACRSDFISRCAGVQPGGRDALMCLERNQAEVSPSCQTALAAIGGGAPGPGASSPGAPGPSAAVPDAGAPAAPTDRLVIPRLPLRAEIMILRVCAADHRDLCGDVPPGGGRIVGCLARNAPRLMPECRAVLSEIAARSR
jgi:Cysteine rich repeat